MYFENSQVKVWPEISFENGCTITLRKFDKMTGAKDAIEYYTNNRNTANTIQAEWAIWDNDVDISTLPQGLQEYVTEKQLHYKSSQYDSVAVGGGGAKGTTLIGVINTLFIHEEISSLRSVSGASVGSIFAFLIAVGAPGWEVEQFSLEIDITKLTQEQLGIVLTELVNLSLIKNLTELKESCHLDIEKQALCNEYLDKLENEDYLITFEDLQRLGGAFPQKFKQLQIATTFIQNGEAKEKRFATTNDQDKNVAIVQAVQASSALPGKFAPIEIDGTLYFDGGIVNNSPIDECARRPLVISFANGNKNLPEQLTFKEKAFEIVCTRIIGGRATPYSDRRLDIWAAKEIFNGVFFLETGAIDTRDFRNAATKFHEQMESTRRQIITFRAEQHQIQNCDPEQNKQRMRYIEQLKRLTRQASKCQVTKKVLFMSKKLDILKQKIKDGDEEGFNSEYQRTISEINILKKKQEQRNERMHANLISRL